MPNLLFIDGNLELVRKVHALGIPALQGDYFEESAKIEHPVLMTASNPRFTFGGGIDWQFLQLFPIVKQKQSRGGGMERVENIVFAITVDDTLRASKEQVRKALDFAISTLKENETLCFSGLGCGIGGNKNFGPDQLCEVLKEVLGEAKREQKNT